MEPTIIEMDDTSTVSSGGSTSSSPMQLIKRCQRASLILLVGMLANCCWNVYNIIAK